MILAGITPTPTSDQELLALQRPGSGVVSLAVPSEASDARLALEVLLALGKTVIRGGATPAARRALDDARLWLAAHETRCLVLVGADTADPAAIAPLDGIARGLGITLWLTVDAERLGAQRTLLYPLLDHVGTLDELRAMLPPELLDEPRPSVLREEVWPRELDRLQGSENPDAYRLGFWGAAAVRPPDRANELLLAGALRHLLEPLDDRWCLASALRGATVALREHAWRVHVDLALLAGRPRPVAQLEAEHRLDIGHATAFVDPLAGSILTLAALDLTEREMLAAHRSDVVAGGAAVKVGRDLVPVPRPGRATLRAQLLCGADIGARPDHPLLGDPASIGISVLRSTILSLYDELGVPLTQAALRDRPSRDAHWLLERGVSLERLDGSRRPARVVGIYDPEQVGADMRADLQAGWAEGSVGTTPCACRGPHIPPPPSALPVWPGRPGHAANGPNHPWRRGRDTAQPRSA